MPFDTIENVLHWTRQASGAYKIKRQNSVSVYVFHNKNNFELYVFFARNVIMAFDSTYTYMPETIQIKLYIMMLYHF